MCGCGDVFGFSSSDSVVLAGWLWGVGFGILPKLDVTVIPILRKKRKNLL